MSASTIRTCAPQRQKLFSMPSLISCSDGEGFFKSRPVAFIIMPGVQNPHCKASCSTNASWTGCNFPSLARPSIVTTFFPATSLTARVQDLAGSLSTSTVQEPQKPIPQPYFVPVSPKWFRKTHRSVWVGSIVVYSFLPFN